MRILYLCNLCTVFAIPRCFDKVSAASLRPHPNATSSAIITANPTASAAIPARPRPQAAGTSSSSVAHNMAPAAILSSQGSAPATGLAGTGMTVEYTRGGEVVQTLTMVVTGDLNGDGRLDISDVVQLQGSLLGRVTLSDAAAQAADVNGDGRIDISDMVQMTAALLGRSSVKPN